MKRILLKRPKLRQCFMPLFLIGVFVSMFPSMLRGIDLTDMAYMLAKYKYVFDQKVPVNGASIIMTDIIGGILYHAVPEGQVFLLTLACWGLNCGMALLSFYLLREYLNGFLLIAILAGGGVFSIAFIHIVHYDTLSMFFQILAFFVLIKGLDEKNKNLITISGFILGLNIFVRLPNILQTSFVLLIIWYFGQGIKKNKKTILSYIGRIVIGICSGSLLGVLLCVMTLGKSGIKNLLFGTMKTLLDSSSSYSAVYIKNRFYDGISSGLQNAAKYEIVIIVFVILLLGFVKIYFQEENIFSEKARMRCYKIVEIVSGILMLAWAVVLCQKLSHIPILEILVTNAIVICMASAFYLRKKDIRLSTICLGCVFMELILTVGTNNGTGFYVVFMGFPMAVTVCSLWKSLGYSYNPIKNSCKYMMSITLAVLLCIEGYQYHSTFVYRDSPKESLNCEAHIKEYKGIKTSAERAGYLDSFVKILEPYNDYEMITLGDFAIGYVITNMIPFFTSTWPDLTSFSIESFQRQIEVKLEQDIYPVIVLADVYQTGEDNSPEKIKMVLDVIRRSEKYKMAHEDEYYRVYVPIEAKKDNE